MRLKIRQFIGWILLIIGLAIIFWGLYSSYKIFTVQTAAPEIFKVAEEETVLFQEDKTQGAQVQIEEKIQEIIGEQLKGIIPVETLPTLFNLIAWSIFVGILIFGGAQISSLGIKLLAKR